MKMRMPAVPLITVDPYFSVWSANKINTRYPMHWTGSRNAILGIVTVDGTDFRFLGNCYGTEIPQISVDIDAFSTTAVFKNDIIELTAEFTTPLLADDLYYASRPVSYLKLSCKVLDGKKHTVTAQIAVSEELVLNKAGEGKVLYQNVECDKLSCVKLGRADQTVLNKSGDDVRIDWGYFYLATDGTSKCGNKVISDLYAVFMETPLENEKLFVFAYDDIDSIIYFEKPLKAFWKKGGKSIEDAITEGFYEYGSLIKRCKVFSDKLKNAAVKAGGEKYAELLMLAYRQVMAGHKLVVDGNGENLYVSKECSSNGCAATVDVTYPSAPMYLYYNTELLKGMLRPVLCFAKSEKWQYDFAPHDVGIYPILNGQVYGMKSASGQMPVEECGNMLILFAAIAKRENNAGFAKDYLPLLEKWSKYLIECGEDPGNQLCTDDFTGHLSHNCNLSVKAITGIYSYAIILEMSGKADEAEKYRNIARDYAKSFCERAKNADGSYRLAFDMPESFSLKYNAVWDLLWKTDIFPGEFYRGEISRYLKEALPYGIPLDSREKYTKSDWLLWVACMGDNKEFEFIADLVWSAYNTTGKSRPMADWFYANTADWIMFHNRTVQGGLFMKLLFRPDSEYQNGGEVQ